MRSESKPFNISIIEVLLGPLGEQVRVVGGSRHPDTLVRSAAGVAEMIGEQLQTVGSQIALVAENVIVTRLRGSQATTVAHRVPVGLERVRDHPVDCRSSWHVDTLDTTRVNVT